MPIFVLKTGCDSITLAQALKAAGEAQSGGEAKALVRAGSAVVNGEPATQAGRQLHVGDSFGLTAATVWTVGSAPAAN